MVGGKDGPPGPFVATARLIANGSAPEWLTLGLAHTSASFIVEGPIPDERGCLIQMIGRRHAQWII
jgi:hypothetical protein